MHKIIITCAFGTCYNIGIEEKDHCMPLAMMKIKMENAMLMVYLKDVHFVWKCPCDDKVIKGEACKCN